MLRTSRLRRGVLVPAALDEHMDFSAEFFRRVGDHLLDGGRVGDIAGEDVELNRKRPGEVPRLLQQSRAPSASATDQPSFASRSATATPDAASAPVTIAVLLQHRLGRLAGAAPEFEMFGRSRLLW